MPQFGFVSSTDRAFRGPRGRRVAGAIEHTAPLMPGSSGGPIVNLDGRLLGINTNRIGHGFYQAIAADDALRDRIAALGRGESPERRHLGIADGLVRLSVGIEDLADLLDDLDQALHTL